MSIKTASSIKPVSSSNSFWKEFGPIEPVSTLVTNKKHNELVSSLLQPPTAFEKIVNQYMPDERKSSFYSCQQKKSLQMMVMINKPPEF